MSEDMPPYNADYIPAPPSRLKLGDSVWFNNTTKLTVAAINYTKELVIFDDAIRHAEYHQDYAYNPSLGHNYNQRAYLLSAFVWNGRWELLSYAEWKEMHREDGWEDSRWSEK